MSVRYTPPRRRRPTDREYMVRRVGALVLVVLVGVMLVSVVRAIGGSGGEAGADDTSSSTTPGVDGSTAVPGATASSVADVASSTSTSTTVPVDSPKAPHVPTAGDPAIVYVAGDSDAGSFGPYLQTLLKQTGVAKMTLDYKVSSGLARPDFFDWPANFRSKLPQVKPDIVVVTFGGNDAQPIKGNAVDSDAWRAEYGKRVGDTMDQLMANGRTLVWVGIPNASEPNMTARMKVQDEVVRTEVAKRPAVVFIDTWKRFSGRDGGYAEYVVDPRDSVGKPVRAKDGFHLNTTGAEILALDIAEAVRTDLRTRGAAL